MGDISYLTFTVKGFFTGIFNAQEVYDSGTTTICSISNRYTERMIGQVSVDAEMTGSPYGLLFYSNACLLREKRV